MRKVIAAFLFTLVAVNCMYADVHGKIDAGPLLMRVDVLKAGNVVKKLEMRGVRANGTIVLPNGLCLKPDFMYAYHDAIMFSGSLAAGFYYPIMKNVSIAPFAGVAASSMRIVDAKRWSNSWGPYVGIDCTWKLHNKVLLSLGYQYGWSRTYTKVLTSDSTALKAHVQGPSYTGIVDYIINDTWGATFAAAYNISKTKEKYGTRGKGGRLGICYKF